MYLSWAVYLGGMCIRWERQRNLILIGTIDQFIRLEEKLRLCTYIFLLQNFLKSIIGKTESSGPLV